ncbi:hypothetical protein ON010_g16071 [Phytophthora cinnamomi]|nr:hypothetical protein ON010_g16071 [Phytophthora cinnamomi]
MSYVLLAIAAALVASTDASSLTSATSDQTNVADLVRAGGAQPPQMRFLRKRANDQKNDEERAGNLDLLTFLPKFVKQMKGKSTLVIMHHLQLLRFTDSQRQAFFVLYDAHLEKAAKAAAAAGK